MAGTFGRLVLEIALGPLVFVRRSALKSLLWLLLVVALTLLTQVGGAILWLSFPFLRRLYQAARAFGRVGAAIAATIGFIFVYVAVGQTIVPSLAGAFGREPLPCLASERHRYAASSLLYCLAHRNYAATSIHRLLDGLAKDIHEAHPGSIVTYLDAGFPFLDGFPLLPHLSHDDGRKIDLAFFYRDARTGAGEPRGGAWPLGYWAYTPPKQGEPRPCANFSGQLTLRWDFDWLQPAFAGSDFDQERTHALISWLVANAEAHRIEKILLEPHLKMRLGIESSLIRFQGCRAARHDDHLHLQVR